MTDKLSACLDLLSRNNSVFVTIIPSAAPGVILPPELRNKRDVVLQLGYSMTVPIPDLEVDSFGIRATLSFGRTPYTCVVPWDAVFAIAGEHVGFHSFGAVLKQNTMVVSGIAATPPRVPFKPRVIEGGKRSGK